MESKEEWPAVLEEYCRRKFTLPSQTQEVQQARVELHWGRAMRAEATGHAAPELTIAILYEAYDHCTTLSELTFGVWVANNGYCCT